MLDVQTRGENISVTDALRDYVEKKVTKLERYLDPNVNAVAHANLRVYPDKTAKAEVTIPLPYLTLRAEETSDDLYKSIDTMSDRLERQIRKYKTKVNRKSREKGYKGLDFRPEEEAAMTAQPETRFDVVRTKSLQLKPMDNEEAILQMDLLGHDFFIYEDAETNDVNVVYRRNDGRYGLLQAGANE